MVEHVLLSSFLSFVFKHLQFGFDFCFWVINVKAIISGSKSAAINVEARPIDSSVYTRRCIISKLTDFTIDKYKEMVNQNAAGVLILLPKNLDALNSEEKEVNIS